MIADVSAHVLRTPPGQHTFYSSQAAFPERNSLLVRVETDDGLVGWGEAGQYGPPGPAVAVVEQLFGPALIGRATVQPVAVWEELYAQVRDFSRMGPYLEALSAIDVALWDLLGQQVGLPVHALLGGAVRDRVTAYATGCYYTDSRIDRARMLDELAEEAGGYAAQGFGLLKMKVGLLPIAGDAERVATVRRAIGTDVGLMVDANHAYNAAGAVRMGRHLEEQDVLWFEEPVVPEDRSGYRRVREALDVAIAGGEAEATRYGFRDLIAEGCIDIAQPDIGVCGGLSELVKIAAIASAFGVPVVPHVWGSGIALAAALQALAVLPMTPFTFQPVPGQNEPVVEFDRKHNPLRDDLLTEPFRLRDGALDVPQAPGLGVTVDEAVLRRYSSVS